VKVSLAVIARDVIETLKPLAAEKCVNIELSSPDAGIGAWADPDRIAEVLLNLIGNAIKFTPAEGKVTISLQSNGARWAKLSVADTGPGIPSREAARVFDKFYQIAQPQRQKTRGTGLGLSIAKALVEMHGGEIWVESAEGKGSTFVFTLPTEPPESSGISGD
jgi:signal transduction histidine kinase